MDRMPRSLWEHFWKWKFMAEITAFGGGGLTSTKILQRCRMSPKSWQKYFLNGLEIFFQNPFMCHISTKSVWILFKLVQCTSMVRLLYYSDQLFTNFVILVSENAEKFPFNLWRILNASFFLAVTRD